jgi:hypothetical protein
MLNLAAQLHVLRLLQLEVAVHAREARVHVREARVHGLAQLDQFVTEGVVGHAGI